MSNPFNQITVCEVCQSDKFRAGCTTCGYNTNYSVFEGPQDEPLRIKETYTNELWQDIVDAVCEAFDCPAASAVRVQNSVSNIVMIKGYKHEEYLLSDKRSKTSVMRQHTAEYAYNVAIYQHFYLCSMFTQVLPA